eukprot:scaffold37538_cov250-Skeletonema_dohrnii-CCMP3373.AAC.1
MKGDYRSAFGYLIKAAELGDAEAQYSLAGMYRKGHGVLVLRRTRGWKRTIGKRLLLEGIPLLDTILGVTSGTTKQ